MDHPQGHAAAGKVAAVDDRAAHPKTPPKAPTAVAAGGEQRGFKWDVNAPEFKPHAANA